MKKLLLLFIMALTICTLASCKKESNELVIVRLDQGFIGDNEDDLSVSIGIKKGNTELQNLINGALAKISQDERNQLMVDALERANGNAAGEVVTLPAHDASKPNLVVGLECDYSPFNWTDIKDNDYNFPIDGLNGQYADGYDIQIAALIAKEIGYNLVIKKYNWDALIPALQSNDINAIIAGMTDTEERRQSIDFTDKYYTSELVLVVKKSSPLASITNISELSGYKVISQLGTVTDTIIDQIPGVKHLTPVDTFRTAAMAVMSGDADAMTAEYPVALSIVISNK